MGAELSALQRIVPETAPRSLHNGGSRFASIQFANTLLRSSIGVNKPDGCDEREAEAMATDACACGGHCADTPCADCAKKMVDGGMQLITPSPAMIAELRKRTDHLLADFMKKVPVSQAPIKAFLAEVKRA